MKIVVILSSILFLLVLGYFALNRLATGKVTYKQLSSVPCADGTLAFVFYQRDNFETSWYKLFADYTRKDVTYRLEIRPDFPKTPIPELLSFLAKRHTHVPSNQVDPKLELHLLRSGDLTLDGLRAIDACLVSSYEHLLDSSIHALADNEPGLSKIFGSGKPSSRPSLTVWFSEFSSLVYVDGASNTKSARRVEISFDGIVTLIHDGNWSVIGKVVVEPDRKLHIQIEANWHKLPADFGSFKSKAGERLDALFTVELDKTK